MVLFILNRRRLRPQFAFVDRVQKPLRVPRNPTQTLAHGVLASIHAATPGGLHQWHPRRYGVRVLVDFLFALAGVLTLTYLAFRM